MNTKGLLESTWPSYCPMSNNQRNWDPHMLASNKSARQTPEINEVRKDFELTEDYLAIKDRMDQLRYCTL